MAKKHGEQLWLGNFSYVLTRQTMRDKRGAPEHDVFASSKPVAIVWLLIMSAISGVFGGLLVSGALWRDLYPVPLWLVAFILVCIVTRKISFAISGSYLAFLTGWILGWGLLIGICAMWAAQLSSAGWVYGIAGGLGFVIGITQGVYEPDDLDEHNAFFALGMVLAPGGAALSAWLYRNMLESPSTLEAAAIAGGLAGFIFLGPPMGFLIARLKNVAGLKRVAALLLHSDETAPEALPLLDTALAIWPDNAELIERRALARMLLGKELDAELDWARHAKIAPNSPARDIAEGWLHLRRDSPTDAALAFERAVARRKRDPLALVGLGLAHLRLGDGKAALAALEVIPEGSRDALALSYLAEAHLLAGNAERAVGIATDAIDELDSIHGRSWLVRGDARRALGNINGAARDYNMALQTDDELGLEEQALARLEEIDRPIEEQELD